MERLVTALYDANILYPAPLRDLFIRLAQAALVQAKWTTGSMMNGSGACCETTRCSHRSASRERELS